MGDVKHDYRYLRQPLTPFRNAVSRVAGSSMAMQSGSAVLPACRTSEGEFHPVVSYRQGMDRAGIFREKAFWA